MMGSAGVYRAAAHRERKGGGKRSDRDKSSLICEVNLNLNYLMYHDKEILSEVESSEQKQI